MDSLKSILWNRKALVVMTAVSIYLWLATAGLIGGSNEEYAADRAFDSFPLVDVERDLRFAELLGEALEAKPPESEDVGLLLFLTLVVGLYLIIIMSVVYFLLGGVPLIWLVLLLRMTWRRFQWDIQNRFQLRPHFHVSLEINCVKRRETGQRL